MILTVQMEKVKYFPSPDVKAARGQFGEPEDVIEVGITQPA
jgi:hypothetical protein